MHKNAILIVLSMKSVAVLIEDGIFALFFHSRHKGFGSSSVPAPGNLPSKTKNGYAGG